MRTKENSDCRCRQDHADPELEAEGVSHTLVVALSEILRSENSCTGYPSENAKVIDKKKLVDNCNAGHLLGTDLSYHDVVQKADKVGDCLLNHNRYGHPQHHQIKVFAANVSTHKIPHKYLLLQAR